MKREALELNGWLRALAPSDELRCRFGHDPAGWTASRHRYVAELDARPRIREPLLEAARQGNMTSLYAVRDAEYNNAVALKPYLEQKLRGEPREQR